MPIYEFICEQCRNQFEKIVSSLQDREGVACNKCGSRKVRKTISAPCARVSSSGPSIPLGSGLGGCSSRSGFS